MLHPRFVLAVYNRRAGRRQANFPGDLVWASIPRNIVPTWGKVLFAHCAQISAPIPLAIDGVGLSFGVEVRIHGWRAVWLLRDVVWGRPFLTSRALLEDGVARVSIQRGDVGSILTGMSPPIPHELKV